MNKTPFTNVSKKQLQSWGKLGGRPRIHLNSTLRNKEYRKRKLLIRLAEMQKNEMLKLISERKQFFYNAQTGRINCLKRKKINLIV